MKNPWMEEVKALRTEEVPIIYSTGEKVIVTLRELTIPQATAAAVKGEEYAGKFGGVDEQGNQRFFVPPIPGAEPVALDETFCQSAASIEAMQAKVESVDEEEKRTPENPYSFGDLVGMAMRMKEEYIKVANAAARIQTGGNALRPPAAGGAPSSAPPSTTTSPIPPSPGTSAGASGVSTNGSGPSGSPLEQVKRGKRSRSPVTST